MAKTVCIIGAGPAGLVAAKTLIHDHPKDTFHVTVFDQSHRIGGLWPISKVDDGMVNPDMCVNQSRHTVSFSDLAWPETAASFPKAWEVGLYLERYIKTYPGYEIRLKTKVVETNFREGKWKVRVREQEGDESYEFDHLIVATGFFGKPKIPQIFNGLQVPVWHSSKVREVQDLLTDGGTKAPASGKNIVVIGGQMSGVETAGSLAFQISSAVNTPGEPPFPDPEKYVVSNIIQKPVWVMPLFFPKDPDVEVSEGGVAMMQKNPSPTFLPLDLVNYNLSWRPPGPIQNTSGHVTPEGAQMVHGFMQTYIGTDQTDLGRNLALSGDIRSEPPLLACSDHYTEFVRQKKIQTHTGKVKRACSENALEVEDGSGSIQRISDVAAVVCATGFDASASLDFLPEEILKTLQFDPGSDGFPLALNVHTTVSRKVPSLGFVGFYRSPYWGVIEMQARFAGKLWSGDAKAAQALANDTTMDLMLPLRNDPRRAQFPMGDYAYLMESLSEIVGIKRQEPEGAGSTARTGIVLPPRYLPDSASDLEKHEAKNSLDIIDRIFDQCANHAKFVARAVFRALQGIWHLDRNISSRIDTFPSGTLSGQASFLPRYPTNKDAEMEHLYFEEGEFRPSWGGTMSAKRSYVYHYSEVTDKINVWFAKTDYKTSDYFFHELEFFVPEKKGAQNEPWRAKSSHLCIDDLYNVTYEFSFSGTVLAKWTSRYEVKGPKKDYIIENMYTRPK